MRLPGWLVPLSLCVLSAGCGIKANVDDGAGGLGGTGPAGKSQACPVRNIQGSVLVQNLVRVYESDGTWDPNTGKVKLTMLFSTMLPSDGTLQIVQQLNALCASRENLVRGHTVAAVAAVPQGGSNCQAAAIAVNDPACAE